MSTEKEEVFLGSSHAKENGDADGTKLVRLTIKCTFLAYFAC